MLCIKYQVWVFNALTRNLESTDPDKMFVAIKSDITEPETYTWFTKTLRALLFIPNEVKLR
jgi:hypothetical protein